MVAPNRFGLAMLSLRSVQVLLAAAICVSVHRAFTRAPIDLPPEDSGPVPASQTPVLADTKPLDWYAPIWQRDLRQPHLPPLVNNPNNQPAALPPSLPRLVSTFVEAGRSWACFRTSAGRNRIYEPQDTVDAYHIVAIQPGRVQLARGDTTHWVEVPRRTSSGRIE